MTQNTTLLFSCIIVNTTVVEAMAQRTTKTVTHQATVVGGVHLLELLNGGSDSGCEEETSLGDITKMAVLQQGTVPEREREGERGGEGGKREEGGRREGGRKGGREGGREGGRREGGGRESN